MRRIGRGREVGVGRGTGREGRAFPRLVLKTRQAGAWRSRGGHITAPGVVGVVAALVFPVEGLEAPLVGGCGGGGSEGDQFVGRSCGDAAGVAGEAGDDQIIEQGDPSQRLVAEGLEGGCQLWQGGHGNLTRDK